MPDGENSRNRPSHGGEEHRGRRVSGATLFSVGYFPSHLLARFFYRTGLCAKGDLDRLAEMAKWIAGVAVEANAFRLDDSSVVWDRQANRYKAGTRPGQKRAAPEGAPASATKRLLKHPQIAALRERILLKSARAAEGNAQGVVQ